MDLSPTLKLALAELPQYTHGMSSQHRHTALLLWLSTGRALSHHEWLEASLSESLQSLDVIITPSEPFNKVTPTMSEMNPSMSLNQLYQLMHSLEPSDLVQAMLANEFGPRFTTSKPGQWLIQAIGNSLSEHSALH